MLYILVIFNIKQINKKSIKISKYEQQFETFLLNN